MQLIGRFEYKYIYFYIPCYVFWLIVYIFKIKIGRCVFTLEKKEKLNTDLWKAFQNYDVKGMEDALRHGAEANWYSHDNKVPFILDVVASCNWKNPDDKESAVQLLLLFGADVNSRRMDKGKIDRAAIHQVVTNCKPIEVPGCIALLKRKGFDLDSTDADGNTALHLALKPGTSYIGAAPHLIESGVSVDIANNAGITCRSILAGYQRLTPGMRNTLEAFRKREQALSHSPQSAAGAAPLSVSGEGSRGIAAGALLSLHSAASAPQTEEQGRKTAVEALLALPGGCHSRR